MLALSGCGGQSEHDGADTAPDVPLGPCSELVLRASPRVVMSTASGSASGPVVLQRDGGFDVIAQFSGERDASLPTIQARRVSLVDGRSELKLGPLTKIGNSASGWTEAVTLEAGLGLCTTSTVAVIGTAEAGGYQPDWTASPGETSGACTGIVPLSGSLLTAMRSRVDDGSVGTVTTWSQGVLESERTPWPAPGGLDADVSLAPLTDGYASAAALDHGARIEVELPGQGDGPERTTIDWEFGEMRQPELAAWPEAPGAVAAVWRELEGDPTGSTGFPYQAFELRMAVVAPTEGLLLGPTTLASSALAGTPASLGSVDEKLLVASLVQPDAASDELEVVLRLLDERGETMNAFSTAARDASGVYPGAAVAALDRHVLLAWTASQPGDATYRWTEVHAALLECR